MKGLANQPPIIVASLLIMAVTVPFIIGMLCWILERGPSLSCKEHCNYSQSWTPNVVVPLINTVWRDSVEDEFICEAVMIHSSVAVVTSDCIDPRKFKRDEHHHLHYRLRFGSPVWWNGGIIREVLNATTLYESYPHHNSIIEKLEDEINSGSNQKNRSFVLHGIVALGVRSALDKEAKLPDDLTFDNITEGNLVDFKARKTRHSYERHMNWDPYKNKGLNITLDKNCASINGGMPRDIFCGVIKGTTPKPLEPPTVATSEPPTPVTTKPSTSTTLATTTAASRALLKPPEQAPPLPPVSALSEPPSPASSIELPSPASSVEPPSPASSIEPTSPASSIEPLSPASSIEPTEGPVPPAPPGPLAPASPMQPPEASEPPAPTEPTAQASPTEAPPVIIVPPEPPAPSEPESPVSGEQVPPKAGEVKSLLRYTHHGHQKRQVILSEETNDACKNEDDFGATGRPLMNGNYLVGVEIYRLCRGRYIYIFKRITTTDLKRALL